MSREKVQPVDVAFVGMGVMAWRHHVALGGMDGVRVVGGVSRIGAGHQPAKPEYGPNVNWGQTFGRKNDKDTQHVDRMLDRLHPDLVYVSVLPDQHGTYEEGDSIEQKLTDRGIPFMVDKPLHTDAVTPAKTAAAVAETGLIAGGLYQHRASPVTEAALYLLEEHPVEDVTIRYYSGGLYDPGIPRWWMNSGTSGTPVVEQVAHVLDQARYLLGEVDSVNHAEAAYYNPPDLVERWQALDIPSADIPTETAAELIFEGGIPARLETTAIQVEGKPRIELAFSCADGSTITWTRQELDIKEPGKSVRLAAQQKDFIWTPIRRLDERVILALREGDPTLLHSSYADAKKTHDLTVAIREKSGENIVPRVLFAEERAAA